MALDPVVLAQAATAAKTTLTPPLLVLAVVVGAAHDTVGLGSVVLAAGEGFPLPLGLADGRGLGGRRGEHLADDVQSVLGVAT